MTLSVDEAIVRVPQWDGREIQTSVLAGGITNQNYKVVIAASETYVLRIGGANAELLGVNRQIEYEANLAAARIGIAPEVVYLIEPEQYLVTRFVEGQPIMLEEIGQPEMIRRIIEALKQIHALPSVACEFNPFRFVENSTRIVKDYPVPFPDNFDWIMACAQKIENTLGLHPSTLRLCHNDLLNANFLISSKDGKLAILDWEYAAMGDPFFDLANFTANNEFSDGQARTALAAYFGDVRPQDFAHLKLMQIMSDFREAMWGMVQLGVSKLDFDFRAYSDKHFDRLSARLKHPQFKRWLEDVAMNDR